MRLNKITAEVFSGIAQLLELLGENPFRIRAYENAARRINVLNDDLVDYLYEGRLTDIPGIGKDLEEKIKEIYDTGTLQFYEELKERIPSGVIEMLKLQGLGPKKVKVLYEKLGVETIAQLKKAVEEDRLSGLSGFGKKTQENILKAIEFYEKAEGTHALGQAIEVANGFIDFMKGELGEKIEAIEVAGSVRRFKETVHDIDILIISDDAHSVMDTAARFPGVEFVIAQGLKKTSVVAESVQIDVRVFKPGEYGSALMYFTGSKAHNISVRKVCQGKGWTLNEYGLFDSNEKLIASESEEDIYKALGMQFVPPEIREGLGEVELALEGKLPKLVDISDIRGDLHMHTLHSDGLNSIEEMAVAGVLKGYEYIAITDHSRSLKVANGLDRDRLIKQMEEVKALNKKIKGIRIFTGIEVDILSDGTLDCDEDLLKELDVVIAAVHVGFKMSGAQMTERIVKALKTGLVNILAHPNGRLLNVRDAYDVDIDEVFKAGLDYNVAMEINSSPRRLDLSAEHAHKAVAMGLKIAINTDSHRTAQLGQISFGVHTARRGWLKKENVINTLGVKGLEGFLG